jgi:hypothetical protein
MSRRVQVVRSQAICCFLVSAVSIVATSQPVSAQTLPPPKPCSGCGDRLGVGVQVTFDAPATGGSSISPRPFLTFGTGAGLGPAVGFNWLTINVDSGSAGTARTLADVNVRPVMGGINYTKLFGTLALTAGGMAGWSFNSLHNITVTPNNGVPASYSVNMNDAVAVKGEVTALQRITSRTRVQASVGYLYVSRQSSIDVSSGSTVDHIALHLSSLRGQVGFVYVLF